MPRTVRRVVSLVPSLTEALACSDRGLLVGATRYCSHPTDLDVARVGGTKNPDVAAVLALRPDLVLANAEENRAADLDALRAAGCPVWVTAPTTVAAALDSLARLLAAAGTDPQPAWLREAQAAWSPPGPATAGALPVPVVVPIWRRPWMALGRDTFAGDVLRRLGFPHVLSGAADRYPRLDPGAPPVTGPGGARLVVLPDEPYAFTATDGPEAFPGLPCALVSGRHLTWYGPSLAEAATLLPTQLARTVTAAAAPGGCAPG